MPELPWEIPGEESPGDTADLPSARPQRFGLAVPDTWITFDMVRDPDAWPVRSHCEILVHNDPAP